MYFVLSAVLALLIPSFGECVSVNNTQSRIAGPIPSWITVDNGQNWATWGDPVMCPSGTYATGFSLKVQPDLGFFGDDTALNGIALQCSKPIRSSIPTVGSYTKIKGTEGSWGSWRNNIWCPSGVLRSFQLRVQSYQGVFSDDTAANNIRFKCTGNQVLEGSGMSWGSWGSWSSVCGGTGICGLQTKVEPPQGILWDDSSLNDVLFYCC